MAPQPGLSRPGSNTPTERRHHSRHVIDRDVRLSWQDRHGDHYIRARALDASKYGLLLEVDREIALGVVVSVGTKAVLYGRGCVRHCTPSGSQYLIGLNTPDHMTALMVSMDEEKARP